jgi:ubiquinol-cytochrome c reductase cytochrome c1 subunit
MKRMRTLILGAVCATVLSTFPLSAAEGPKAPSVKWSFSGIFGTYDRAALRRGLQVYREVCQICHSLDLVAYRNLGDIGFSEDEVKKIAADYEVEDGPNDEGEMFIRPGKPYDKFVNPYPNVQSARLANNGATPPDLSLVVKARVGRENYIHAFLTSYRDEAPETFQMMDGMFYNEYFPGHQTVMPPPLEEDSVEYTDGTKATTEQMSKDVVTFLTWAAEPKMEHRKNLGIKVLLYVLVLTGMLYALKRRIWSRVH